MTINSTTRKAGPFIGNGVTTVFSFSFKVFTAAEVKVVRLDVSTNAETVLALSTNYNVNLNADQNSNPGGSITLVGGALAIGFNLVITSSIQNLQPTDLTNQGGFYPDVINASLDRATIQIQQLQEGLDRAALIPITSGADPTALIADIARIADSADNLDTVANNIGNVNTVATNIASVNSASTNMSAIIAAPTQASNAAASASAAATSASAAAAAAASSLFSAVQDKSANYTVVIDDAGDLFRVSTTSGAVTITLPNITSPMLDGFRVAVAKYTSDTNLVEITGQAGQLINGTSIYSIDVIYEMVTLVADLETQTWFASGSGVNVTSTTFENFNGNNVQTVFTLANDPGTANAVDIYINGVYQQKNQYTLVGTTITFTEPPPRGTTNIEARYTLPVPIGAPSNNTVTTAKIVDGAVTGSKIAANSVDGTKINLASNAVGDLMRYDGTDWVRLPKPTGSSSNRVLKHGWTQSTPIWTQGAFTEVLYLDNVSAYQYAIPDGFRFARIYIFGAGGGGGSGQWQTNTATACGGGGGGGAGALGIMEFSADAGEPPLFTFTGGARGLGGVGSFVMGTAGTNGTAGTALTVTVNDSSGYSVGTSFTIAAGAGGAAGTASGGGGGAGGAAPANTAPQSFLYVAAGLAGGAGTLGAIGTVGAVATALLQAPGGGGGAGLAASGGNTSFAGGNSSTTWIGQNRTLKYDQAAGSSSVDGAAGGNGSYLSGHLGIVCAAGSGGGNSGTTSATQVGDGGSTYGYGCGGGGGGGTRNSFQNRGSNGGDGAPATMIVLCW